MEQTACKLLQKRSITVTCSEVDIPSAGIHCEAGGMALAAWQISRSLNQHLAMQVRLLFPATSVVPIDRSWHPVLSSGQLINFTFVDGERIWFQIFSRQIADSSSLVEALAIVEVNALGAPKATSDSQTYFRQFPDFNFRIEANRQRGSRLLGVNNDAQLLKIAVLAIWNDVLAQAITKLEAPDAIMFSNYADNRLPELLEYYCGSSGKFAKTALLHMNHAELGGPKEGLAKDSRAAKSLPYGARPAIDWLIDAIRKSDATLMNYGYASSLARQYADAYGKSNEATPLLHELSTPTRVAMHLGVDYRPDSTEGSEHFAMPNARFVPLDTDMPRTAEEISSDFLSAIARFKRCNRFMLYRMLEAIPQMSTWQPEVNAKIGWLQESPESRLITYFDRIDPTKGALWFLEVLPNIMLANPKVQVIVASGFTKMPELGNTAFLRAAEVLAQKFGGRFVLLLGQPDRKILDAASDYAVRLSLGETYSLRIIEAMAMGGVPLYYEDHAHLTVVNSQRGFPVRRLSDLEVKAQVSRAKACLCSNNARTPLGLGDLSNMANATLFEAIHSALAVPTNNLLLLAARCMLYVTNEHTWSAVMQRRFAPIMADAISRRS